MEKYMVYLFVNSSLREVYFGMNETASAGSAELPPEISHWDFCNHAICPPVMIEEGISEQDARLLILELQEKTCRDPQGKTLLVNLAVTEKQL